MTTVALFTSREMRFGQVATLRYPARIELTPNIIPGKEWRDDFPCGCPRFWGRSPDKLGNFGLLIRHPVRRPIRDAVTRHPTSFEFWTRNLGDGRWIKWIFASVEWMTDGRLLYGVAREVGEEYAVTLGIGERDYPITLGAFAFVDEGPA